MALAGLARRAIVSGRRAVPIGGPVAQGRESTDLRAFGTLSGVGFLDSGTRAAALAFLPFVMKDKGLSDEQVFVMLLFLLAGGAAGKFVCGWLDDRFGSISLIWGTKGLTALLLVASLAAPAYAVAPLMLVLGIGLNGTSSVLYATVSAFIPSRRRATGYGYYYTATEFGGTLAAHRLRSRRRRLQPQGGDDRHGRRHVPHPAGKPSPPRPPQGLRRQPPRRLARIRRVSYHGKPPQVGLPRGHA